MGIEDDALIKKEKNGKKLFMKAVKELEKC